MLRNTLSSLLVLVLVLAGSSAVAAPFGGDTPPELEGIEITDKSGETVPGNIALVDEAGETVTLGTYFGSSRPLVVQLVYYDCPMLCSLVMNGFVESAKELDWVPGRDYEVISVSFDPRDTPEMAAAKKKSYVASLEKPGSEIGWHFLTGDEESVRALADHLGFAYRWLPEKKEFSHAAGMFVLTPDGKISRTLYGISFPSKDLRFSLMEASEGRLGSPMDKLLLYCFQYDPETHKYAMVAVNVMKLGGLLTVLGIGIFLAVNWTRERRRAHSGGEAVKTAADLQRILNGHGRS